ncbi:MAG TPA: DinB family protein, partial [Burkholderiales bacterium]|nr:DinB family protein [Burkholderiales bacterium]
APSAQGGGMTYYGGKELAESFRTVRNNTLQIAEEIPEDSYSFKPSPDSRTIGQTLAHIAMVTAFQTYVHENQIDSLSKVNFPEYIQKSRAEEESLRSKAEIIAALKADGDKFARFLENLPESVLSQSVAMMPGAQPAAKSRLEMLMSAKEHEMHHRGQLMVMQRMLGMTPHLTRQMQERMARQAQAAQAAAAR